MKNIFGNFFPAALLLAFLASSCNDNTSSGDAALNDSTATAFHEQTVAYSLDSTNMNGFIIYRGAGDKKLPAVLVVHEWWGLNDHSRIKAKQLAELGYIAMAVDMYGNGQTAETPDDAMKLAGPFYANPQMALDRLEAARAKLMSLPQTDTSRMAAIGYCFGGTVVLNAARLGANLDGVVSFHGNLVGVPPRKELLNAEVLICHGAADPLVPQTEVDQFKKQMDSVGAEYSFRSYEGALHAFTNPNATEKGQKYKLPIAYNANADHESWEHMKDFLNKVFK